MSPNRVFLTAEWRFLAMLNYEVQPNLLARFVPPETELDSWGGKTFFSLVGFRFLKTRVFGVPFPFHANFDEVNLRFYVSRREKNELRRGVVLIKEIVPRRLIASVARNVYNENYVALPMSHKIERHDAGTLSVEYAWQLDGHWNRMLVSAAGDPKFPENGSAEQFITEHYWGYAKQRDGSCMEYRVAHPSWKLRSLQTAELEGDLTTLYGPDFCKVLQESPASAFLAEGSEVTVYRGRKL